MRPSVFYTGGLFLFTIYYRNKKLTLGEKMCNNEHCKNENCTCDPCECTEEQCCSE